MRVLNLLNEWRVRFLWNWGCPSEVHAPEYGVIGYESFMLITTYESFEVSEWLKSRVSLELKMPYWMSIGIYLLILIDLFPIVSANGTRPPLCHFRAIFVNTSKSTFSRAIGHFDSLRSNEMSRGRLWAPELFFVRWMPIMSLSYWLQ